MITKHCYLVSDCLADPSLRLYVTTAQVKDAQQESIRLLVLSSSSCLLVIGLQVHVFVFLIFVQTSPVTFSIFEEKLIRRFLFLK